MRKGKSKIQKRRSQNKNPEAWNTFPSKRGNIQNKNRIEGENVAEISFKEFQKLDMRVGKVLEAEHIPGSRNLIRMIVDFGTEKRQAVAGLLQWYKPEELVGKKYAFLLNLERRKFMGVESQCMILAAEDNEGNVVALQPEKDVAVGSKIH
ncbi:methionine--tRNA ligase subunit beta [Candidatus Bathyarchaeota archaeon]|nr:MAG: methionine--tRNA ligase subunit beta [Candidatus Bathyarchaeota archaeon]